MKSAVFAIAVLLAALVPAQAQTQEKKLKLSEALPRLRWDSATRGPLLLLDSPHPVPGTHNDTWTSEQLAAAIGLQAVNIGGVTCWISPTMRIFPEPHTAPDISAAMPLKRLRAQLFNSLKEDQKNLLLSEQGLGLNDLNLAQQRLFLKSLPGQLTTRSSTTFVSYPEKAWPEDTIQSVRMRLVRQPLVKLIPTHPKLQDAPARIFQLAIPRHELSYMHTEQLPNGSTLSNPVYTHELPGTLLGAVLFREGTNRLKPSDLNYLAPELRVAIPLSPTTTVGELVAQIAKATRAELHCDPRLGAYVVHCRGNSAPASSVLQALARMLTATFRRIEGQAWLLAAEKESLAARVARRQEWVEPAMKEAEALTAKAFPTWDLNAVPPIGPLADIKAGRQPLSALPAEIRQKVEEHRNRYDDKADADEQRLLSENKVKFRVGDVTLTPDSFEADFVMVSADLEGQLVFPDGTVARDPLILQAVKGLEDGDTTRYPETVALKNAPTLLLRASTPEEARERVQLAASLGIKTLWLELPLKADPDSEQSLLRAAIQEGNTKKVSVGAAVHLLAATPDPDAADRDERLIGGRSLPYPYPLLKDQPFEWVAPDAPGVAARVKARLEKLAGVKGLVGLCFLSTAAPGYGVKLNTTPAEGFGGRPANRLAFVRQFHIDPQDLDRGTVSGPVLDTNSRSSVSLVVPGSFGPNTIVSANGSSMSGPGTADFMRYHKAWEENLFARSRALLNPLYAALQSVAPSLPRWTVTSPYPYSTGSWKYAEPALAQGAKPGSTPTLGFVLCYPGRYGAVSAWDTPTQDGPLALARAVFECEEGKRSSYVLDLRQVPLEEIPIWLKGVTFPE